MKFERHLKLEQGLRQVDIVPFMNVVFLLILFFAVSSFLTVPSKINVKLPKAVTSDVIQTDSIVITITSENIIYFNAAVVTMKELTTMLEKIKNTHRLILVKVDRRSSVGRIVDVWDLCRKVGIERVNMATTQEE